MGLDLKWECSGFRFSLGWRLSENEKGLGCECRKL